MRSKILLLVATAAFFYTIPALAETSPQPKESPIKQPGSVGVGLSLSSTSYFVGAKVYMLKNFSLQLSGPLGGFFSQFGWSVTSHFLYDAPPFYVGNRVDIAWEVGAGPQFYYGPTMITAGASLDLGIQLIFKDIPVDLVFAYQPALFANKERQGPNQSWQFDPFYYGIGISSRYYF